VLEAWYGEVEVCHVEYTYCPKAILTKLQVPQEHQFSFLVSKINLSPLSIPNQENAVFFPTQKTNVEHFVNGDIFYQSLYPVTIVFPDHTSDHGGNKVDGGMSRFVSEGGGLNYIPENELAKEFRSDNQSPNRMKGKMTYFRQMGVLKEEL
jgi:hypothetical protein